MPSRPWRLRPFPTIPTRASSIPNSSCCFSSSRWCTSSHVVPKAPFVVQVIITVGALSALFGIIQFGVLQYDNLGRRPQGALGHYMTYSGIVMLVTCAAAARILFTRDRIWPSLMMPALLVVLGLTFTRSALIGACAGIAFLLLLKDLRLMAVMPVLAALVLRACAAAGHRSVHVDVRRAGSNESGSGDDAQGGRPDGGGTSADRRRADTSRTAIPQVPSCRRNRAARTRTCTTFRCKLRRSVGCRRWPPGSG